MKVMKIFSQDNSGVQAEIRTGHVPNTSQTFYPFVQLVRLTIVIRWLDNSV
jgi:hypothetical protein